MMKFFLGKIAYILKFMLLFGLVFSIFSVALLRFCNPPFTPLMLLRAGEEVVHGKLPRIYKEWKNIEEIAPVFPRAIMASEDQNFFNHYGFDLAAIQKAYRHNTKGGKMKGASTLSQQVAKNVFLWPGRSWLRKGLEVYFTLLIETFWSKKRIMEVYLNIAETGKGIYGVEAASRTYFKRPSAKVTMSQAALIAAILPNPRKWSPTSPSSYIYKRQSWIIVNMNCLGGLDFTK